MRGSGCHVGFEIIGCGIFDEDVVEEGGVLDRGEHGGSGCCYYIAWKGEDQYRVENSDGESLLTAEIKGCWSRS